MGPKVAFVVISLICFLSFQKVNCARLPRALIENETIVEEEKDIAPLIDLLLSNFDQLSRSLKLEPLHVPDLVKTFRKKVLFFTVKAGASLRNGVITGISTLHRTGPCTVKPQEQGITVKADMGVKSMHASFRGSAYGLSEKLHIGADLEAKVENLRVLAVIYQNYTRTSHGELKELDILSMDFDIHINGLGPFSWIINPLIKLVRKIFKTKIDNLIETQVKNAVAKLLSKFHLPLGNGLL